MVPPPSFRRSVQLVTIMCVILEAMPSISVCAFLQKGQEGPQWGDSNLGLRFLLSVHLANQYHDSGMCFPSKRPRRTSEGGFKPRTALFVRRAPGQSLSYQSVLCYGQGAPRPARGGSHLVSTILSTGVFSVKMSSRYWPCFMLELTTRSVAAQTTSSVIWLYCLPLSIEPPAHLF